MFENPATSIQTPLEFQGFINQEYQKRPLRIQRLYPSIEAFRAHYVRSFGFNAWWKSMAGSKLDMPMLLHIAETLTIHGDKRPTDIPSLLITLTRQFDIGLPDESGILEPAFWQRHLSRLR